MFAWARKERLSERNTNCDSAKSNAETRLQSHPSSPAHSVFSLHSTQKGSSSEKKIKVILYSKQKREKKIKHQNIKIENNISKSDLMYLIDQKKGQRQTKNQNIATKSALDRSVGIKRVIKIRIQVNRTLDEYCRATKEILINNIWGIFGAASIMLKMGFIQDLVNDRLMVKQIWESLLEPDVLGLYVYLEQALGNKIQIQMAIETLSTQLDINGQKLLRDKAANIKEQKIGQKFYDILRLNRLGRQKKMFQD